MEQEKEEKLIESVENFYEDVRKFMDSVYSYIDGEELLMTISSYSQKCKKSLKNIEDILKNKEI